MYFLNTLMARNILPASPRVFNRNYFQALQGFFFSLFATLLPQRCVNELGCVAEEGPQVEVLAVRSLHAEIRHAEVAVEAWPRVDALGAVGGVQHVRYPQVHQLGPIPRREPVNTREVVWGLFPALEVLL